MNVINTFKCGFAFILSKRPCDIEGMKEYPTTLFSLFYEHNSVTQLLK